MTHPSDDLVERVADLLCCGASCLHPEHCVRGRLMPKARAVIPAIWNAALEAAAQDMTGILDQVNEPVSDGIRALKMDGVP